MADVSGHLGMALIWLAPSWYFLDSPKMALTVIATSVWFGMVPDVDLLLSNYVRTIEHHGIFHTVLVVTLLAAILGPLVGRTFKEFASRSTWFSTETTMNVFTLGFLGVWTASLSHLFLDMLSAPDIAPPINPFWPLYNSPIIHIDLIWYSSTVVNWGLFVVGVAVNSALGYRYLE